MDNAVEITGVVTTVVTAASAVCAILPAPKTRFGKVLRRLIEVLALNLGSAKSVGSIQK